jgi:hypothetical protein
VPRQHVVCMSEEDFVLFCLKWKPNRNLRFLEWQVVNPPDVQE